MKLILASASPQRKELLANIGIVPDEIIPADVDETPIKGEKPQDYVKRVAIDKAEKIAKDHEGVVIAADTIVAVGRRIIGKAETPEQAFKDVMLMSGRRSAVHTGLCILNGDQRSVKLITSKVKLKNMTKEELDWFIATDEWRGKSGSFSLMGSSSAFIEEIHGSHTNIIGLPVCEVRNILVGMGYKQSS